MKGKVVYLYAFDVADAIRTEEVREVFSQKPFPFQIRVGTQAPKDVRIYQPLTIALPDETRDGALVRTFVKIFNVGVISISFEVEVDAPRCADLVPLHKAPALEKRAEEIRDQTIRNLRPLLVRPNETLAVAEAYTVFCLRDVPGDVETWSARNRREVAALLNEEPDPQRLATAQVEETWSSTVAYAVDDLTVIDWDAALLIDGSGYFDDVLYVIELANLQLEEFRLLDDRLDAAFERAYDDLERYSALRSPRARLRALRSMRMDTTKMSEEVSNITKFMGDWHLARVYLACKDRFHLGHWEASVDQKLQELDRIYSIVHADITARRSMALEVMIVALFIIDVLALFFWKK
ncbi:MAG TPA: hypothetical protein VF950_19865 [Planctomycetota bacterium]